MSNEEELGYRPFPSFQSWTAPFDFAAVDRFFALLDEAKAGATPERLRSAVEIATRYAAVDTGALEGLYATNRGFTRTIATQTATWQAALSERGEPVRRSIEDQLAAYEMVLDLATGHREISASWIRQLHEVVCDSQETFEVVTGVGLQKQSLPKGQWKTQPNNPISRDTGRLHHYAPPHDVAAETARFVDELRSPVFASAHPVAQTAYAHYAFVCIHPFADGNGRVARALASVYLYRRPGVPLVIFADQKDRYLDTLEAADAEDVLPFVSFVAQRVMDTVELVRVSLEGTTRETAAAALAQLSLSTQRNGLSYLETETMRLRLEEFLQDEARRLLGEQLLPPGFTATLGGMGSGPTDGPEGYIRAPAATHPMVMLAAPPPGDASEMIVLTAFAAKATSAAEDFVVMATSTGAPFSLLGVSLQQIHPSLTSVLELKIAMWLQGVIDRGLVTLAEASRRRLEEQGYL